MMVMAYLRWVILGVSTGLKISRDKAAEKQAKKRNECWPGRHGGLLLPSNLL